MHQTNGAILMALAIDFVNSEVPRYKMYQVLNLSVLLPLRIEGNLHGC